MEQHIEDLFSDYIIAYAEDNELALSILRTRIFNLYTRLELSTSDVLEFSDMLFGEVIQ